MPFETVRVFSSFQDARTLYATWKRWNNLQ